MSTSSVSCISDRSTWPSRLLDYVELSKPRIAVLVLVTVAVSHAVASWGQPHPAALIHALVGTLLVAASASAWNQFLERRLDLLMQRTAERPLPSGRLTPREVQWIASVTFAAGLGYLLATLGPAPTVWAALTWILYVLVYTPAKTRTAANTALGAVAGALPVLIGWSAAGSPIDLRGLSLFLLVFLWQFPHFMAIAWLYREEYAAAGMRMMTVVEPTGASAGIQAVWGAVALIPVSIVPALYDPGLGGTLYAGVAALLGFLQLALAVRFCAWRTRGTARDLLRGSLLYLPVVLVLLLIGLWY